MESFLRAVPWGELTAYLVLLVLGFWVITRVVAGLVKGDIVPARQVQVWQDMTMEQQEVLVKLKDQSAEQLRALNGVRYLVEASLPKRGDEPTGGDDDVS